MISTRKPTVAVPESHTGICLTWFHICVPSLALSGAGDNTISNEKESGFLQEDRMGSFPTDIEISAGVIMRMPGLPVSPAAGKMDVDEQGNVTGLF
ncbi:MAG: formate--tetrahydrofolate ligase [Candidatus Sabulitectum sp.]|nr:formate--tetrahydrofolate ligase [Candidatus Sabulitectum sp.]